MLIMKWVGATRGGEILAPMFLFLNPNKNHADRFINFGAGVPKNKEDISRLLEGKFDNL